MLTRLGFECSVMDLFADRDTIELCEGRVTRLNQLADLNFHEKKVRLHDFLVFAGGLESSVAVAKNLTRQGKAAFTCSVSLEKLASYEAFNEALAAAGANRYPFFRAAAKLDCPVVRKDIRHSGTATLVELDKTVERSLPPSTVCQEFIPGDSVSLIFVADPTGVRCLGGSEQVTESLSWVGSISGLQLEANELQSAIRFASALAELVGLVGVFGVDFIRNDSGLWPVDVNPRIPASAEIVGDHVMQNHLHAFGIDCKTIHHESDLVKGKLVVFNSRDAPIRFERKRLADLPLQCAKPHDPVSIADVPHDKELVSPGRPILTVLVSGSDVEVVRSKLSSLREKILGEFTAENG